MASFSKISRSIWDSTTFRQLSNDAKLVYLYLLASRHTNILGVFVCRPGYISADLGYSIDRVSKLCAEIEGAKLREDGPGLVAFDHEVGLVFITNRLAHDKISGPKQIGAALAVVETLPYSRHIFELLVDILPRYGDHLQQLTDTVSARLSNDPEYSIDTVSETETKTETDTETDTDTDTETDTDTPKKPSAKERRETRADELQANYPKAHGRNLSGEKTGRRAYIEDQKNAVALGFQSGADLHAFSLGQLELFKLCEDWQKDGGKYIPGFGKYCKDKLWRRDFSASPPAGGSPLSEKGRRTAASAARVLDRIGD